ncbi:MAG: tyrosine-type recombinase/integrase [Holosporaceae bacterium]|jgi:integrase/recombinase XerC|nr:tyrosine-type recombinase/integrase [Holosporaceae bacterium]
MICVSIKEYIKCWLEELEVQRCYSQHTIDAYRRDVLNFENFLAEHTGEDISLKILQNLKTMDFRSWLSNRISNGLTARSNVRALSALKSFFYHLAKKNLIDLKSINSVKRPKLSMLLPKPIKEDAIISFLNLDSFFENDPEWITDRDRALFSLLYCCGLRINEALNIKTSDVDKEIKILGKGKKDRIIILLPMVLDRINEYILSCPYDLSDGFLFVGLKGKKLHASLVDHRLQKLRVVHNLPDHASAHAFRHSFATHLIQHGADLRSVQELLGHESLSSTQIYTDIDDYNLLKIYANTHPLEKQ